MTHIETIPEHEKERELTPTWFRILIYGLVCLLALWGTVDIMFSRMSGVLLIVNALGLIICLFLDDVIDEKNQMRFFSVGNLYSLSRLLRTIMIALIIVYGYLHFSSFVNRQQDQFSMPKTPF